MSVEARIGRSYHLAVDRNAYVRPLGRQQVVDHALLAVKAERQPVAWSLGAVELPAAPGERLLLRRICREACNGLDAARVAALFPCSRRQAGNRFRRATGRSILEEIHAVQLERAMQLLRDTTVQLKAISDFCGFTNPNSLRKFFLRETGMTMSAYRAASSAHVP